MPQCPSHQVSYLILTCNKLLLIGMFGELAPSCLETASVSWMWRTSGFWELARHHAALQAGLQGSLGHQRIGGGHQLCTSVRSWKSGLNWRLVAQTVKRLPTMWETRIRSLGQEDPLEKEMATHSTTLAWKIPWTEKPGTLQSMGHKELDMTERLHSLTL